MPTSTAVSHGLVVARYSSPPFGSHGEHSHSEPCPLDLGPVAPARLGPLALPCSTGQARAASRRGWPAIGNHPARGPSAGLGIAFTTHHGNTVHGRTEGEGELRHTHTGGPPKWAGEDEGPPSPPPIGPHASTCTPSLPGVSPPAPDARSHRNFANHIRLHVHSIDSLVRVSRRAGQRPIRQAQLSAPPCAGQGGQAMRREAALRGRNRHHTRPAQPLSGAPGTNAPGGALDSV